MGKVRTVLQRNLLRAKMLLHGDGIVCTAFDTFPPFHISAILQLFAVVGGERNVRAIVRNNHTLHSLHRAHTGDYPPRRDIFARVHLMSRQRGEFQEWGPRVDQGCDATVFPPRKSSVSD